VAITRRSKNLKNPYIGFFILRMIYVQGQNRYKNRLTCLKPIKMTDRCSEQA